MAIKVNGKLVAGAGKSAYESAKDGGYTGTEEEFEEMLANAGSKPLVYGVTLSASAWSDNCSNRHSLRCSCRRDKAADSARSSYCLTSRLSRCRSPLYRTSCR